MAPTSSHSPKQEHQQLDQLAILYAMADHIQRARQIDQIYEEAAQGLRRAVAADRSALLIADDRGVLRCKARHGIPDHCLETLEDHSPWPRGTRDPRPLVVEDLTDDHQIGEAAPAFLSEGVRALAFIPLLHRGRLLGNFMIGHDAPRQFTSAELRLAEAIAGHLAFAIWRSRSDADQAELLRRFEAERSVLEAVVKQMPAGVLLADVPSGRIVMTNQRMIEIWQRPYRPAGSVDDYVTWSGVDQAGVRLSPTDWPLARTVLHGETVRGEEVTIVRGDGTERVIRVSSTPVEDSQGRTLAAVAIVDDVTEQKTEEANRRFLEEGTRILNASLELDSTLTALAELVTERHADACAVYRVTDAGTIQQVANARAAGREEVLSTVLPDATVNLEDDNLLAWVTRERKALLVPTLEDGTLDLLHPTEPHQEGLTERLDGGSLMILPLVARDRAVGAMALVRSLRYDENELLLMTELGRRASLATENALLYEKARAADTAKANFLAVMSHEFRTPLSAILGYADILTAEVHGPLNEKQGKHLERVKASVRHLSHLVDEILSYASMEAGRGRLRVEDLQADAIAADVAALIEPIADASGLDLLTVFEDEPLRIRTDESKLRQILINLLSNAVKYTPRGSVELTVKRTDGRVLFAVRDTGPGIAREHMEAVFEPFWQVEGKDERRITGTGLGLSVARRLARLMGGDITLRSVIGEGSTFTLELPEDPPAGVATAPGS